MLVHVKPCIFHLSCHSEQTQFLQGEEHKGGKKGCPAENDDASKQLHAEKGAIATKEYTDVGKTVSGVRIHHILGCGKEANRQYPPESTEAMDGRGIERVINLQSEQEARKAEIYDSSNDSNQHRRPRVHNGAPCRDRYQTCQDTIQSHRQVKTFGGETANEEDSEAATARRKCGGHSNLSCHKLGTAGEDEGASGIESIPSEPEDEATKSSQHRVVTGLRLGLAGSLVKATMTSTHCDGTNKSSSTSSHVHYT
mmetsp:Transcript_43190/g.112001  ORF Transcript_43190/g.112001 Transcript_43190/m.112001 type:complete len:254 (-) Transcript_43190:834-1595(-)